MMQVEISQNHIEAGLWRSYTDDPVCLAVKDAIKRTFLVECDDIFVMSADYIFINGFMFDLDERMPDWINKFDRKEVVETISFEIDIPDDFFQRKNNLPKRKM